jgi:hypothetical protein
MMMQNQIFEFFDQLNLDEVCNGGLLDENQGELIV